ncbi:MAG: hypothetical protein IJ856_02115 [Candidatus Methanomethylophilaceae archaeon]|nr:hypothetical protein [Candidatus Methanomethylophilaceae archaeon]
MAYDVTVIGDERYRELMKDLSDDRLHSSKADINGICVELYTESRNHIEMWNDNFYSMSDRVRPHARLYCLQDGSGLHVEYHVSTRTLFLFDFDYYGWIKSIALGVAGNILEDNENVFSIHGAALDIDGRGVTLIAPSKTGKTTQSWGLLRIPNSRLITDDWFFIDCEPSRPRAHGSEKNCYIDADIGDVWEEYRELVDLVEFDNKGRGIGNVRWITGAGSVVAETSLQYVILLKRDRNDQNVVTRMDADDALAYLRENDYCNPHQLVRDGYRFDRRGDMFRSVLSVCEVYLVNTILPAEKTQQVVRAIVEGRTYDDVRALAESLRA